MRKVENKIIYQVFFSLLFLVCGFVLWPPSPNKKIVGQYYIAHAGGQIEGHNYTNSLEAVDNSLRNGISYIELDLRLTTDSVLVAVHEWEQFHLMTGEQGDSPISLAEFKTRRIYDKYTPISIYDIDSLMQVHDDFYLVTDKTSDPQIIDKYLSKYKKRLCIECFSWDHYRILKEKGYYLPMLSGGITYGVYIRQRFKKIFFNWKTEIPDFFVINKGFHKQSTNPLSLGVKYSWALYTCSTISEADSLFRGDSDIHLIYIDNVNGKLK